MAGIIAGGPVIAAGAETYQSGSVVRLPSLPHTVTLESASTSQNDVGEITLDSWTTVETANASVRPMSSEEFVRAQQRGSRATHKVTMPWSDNITARRRLAFDGRKLNIESVVNPLEQDVAAELEVFEKTD